MHKLSLVVLVLILVTLTSCQQTTATTNINDPPETPQTLFPTPLPSPTPTLSPSIWQYISNQGTVDLKYFTLKNNTNLTFYFNRQMCAIIFLDAMYELRISSESAAQYKVILVDTEVFAENTNPTEARYKIFKHPNDQ